MDEATLTCDNGNEGAKVWGALVKAQADFLAWKKGTDDKLTALRLELERKEADIASRESAVCEAERKRDEGFVAEQSKFNEQVRQKIAQQYAEVKSDWEKEKETLFAKERERIKSLTVAAEEMLSKTEDECAAMRVALEDEYRAKRDTLMAECAAQKDKQIDECNAMQNELLNKYNARQDALEKEYDAKNEELLSKYNAQKNALEKEYNAKTQALSAEYAQRQMDMDAEKVKREIEAKKVNARWNCIDQREQNIDAEVAQRTEERMKSMEAKEQSYKDERDRLMRELKSQSELLSAFDDLKSQLRGEDPERILFDMNTKQEQISALERELNSRPTIQMRNTVDELNGIIKSREDEIERLKASNAALLHDNSETASLREELANYKRQLDDATTAYKDAAAQVNNRDAELSKLREESERLKNTYGAEESRAGRESYIMSLRYVDEDKIPPMNNSKVGEMEYLSRIEEGIKETGFVFPQRLLYAFHTSLKTADMSIMTVLSGVSGTGKSELPKLYSRFGGINFISVPVQPNWDSKESMLGFFNTINNKFDAEPLLEFLVQAQAEANDRGGLKDALNMVLLDEMNLAYVELYFADFLSKLEERRDGSTPSIPLKVGSGMEDVQLNLYSNVLWVGTMNQDETTKALSDKVLDRGIVINFPRPAKFKRRTAVARNDGARRSPLLSIGQWKEWIAKENLPEADIDSYKTQVEAINNSLAKAGRSLGHRVWQSIECYIANHPQVIDAIGADDEVAKKKAIQRAFEDCMVQKIMPKLRGIDTGGEQGKCLTEIQSILDSGGYSIMGDFAQAMKQGAGQFVWCSSDYLNADEGSN